MQKQARNQVIILRVIFGLWVLMSFSACSTTKYVADGQYLLKKVSIVSDDKSFDAAPLEPYVLQKSNSQWFSVFNIPLAMYSASGKDSTKWLNRTMKKFGEAPVIYDSIMAQKTCSILHKAMKNMGYMNSWVSFKTHAKNKKLKLTYVLHPGQPYFINSINYHIKDERVATALREKPAFVPGIKVGVPFSLAKLEEERKRIVSNLMEKGYFHFHQDYITYDADTVAGKRLIELSLKLSEYKDRRSGEVRNHPQYYIRDIKYTNANSSQDFIRRKVLERNTVLQKEKVFNSSALQKTYNNFARLNVIRHTNISFQEVADTNLLDCHIQLSSNKVNTISFQPEGTNTAGDLGVAASLTYENRNLFKGSEMLSIRFRAAYEAITGLEGYQNDNYIEYGAEVGLNFPTFVAPFLSRSFRRNINATSELRMSYNLQNRPEFHRRVLSAGWMYKWSEPHHYSAYKLDLFTLNYIHMPWISETFKQNYLDDVGNRNAILRYNYEDLFIMKIGFGLTYNNGIHALKANLETAGNLLNLSSKLLNQKKDGDSYKLFNIAYAQYIKGDVDYTRVLRFDARNTLVFHAGLGIAYPYGNSTILPFEKRYFSGGANSVRGWNVRRLGPGSYQGSNGNIDFINQTGDIKLDLNMEYRTSLFWKINGALFVDAGNIWTIRAYEEQPGGQFKFREFYKQIAVSYGLGLRLNFDYFVLRFDMGMKAVSPYYETSKEHFPVFYPDLGRDFTFHFAVGMPF